MNLRAHIASAALLATLGAVGPAAAQRRAEVTPVAGSFAATFELVSSNCKDTGMNLDKATIELGEPRKGRVDVTIPMVPLMKGVVSRGGKFKAEAKRGKSGIEGVDGRFSVAGHVANSTVNFLFIAEYYLDDKPLCTQSWNASGPKK